MQDGTVLDSQITTAETCVGNTITSNLIDITGGVQYVAKIGTPSCSGYTDGSGNCWHAGSDGQSCIEVCADKGGTSDYCMEIDVNCEASKYLFETNCSGGCYPYCPAYYYSLTDECYSCEWQDYGDCSYPWGMPNYAVVCVCNSGGGVPSEFTFPFIAGP